MAVESTQQIEQEPVRRWRFTVDDFMLMGKAGIFKEGDRVELIDGEVIEMNPIGFGHAGRVKRLNTMLVPLMGGRAIVSVQDPLQIRPRRQPQPDIMILQPRADFYSTSHPVAADVLLLIEVSDTSLDYDRNTKAIIYAQARIPEYWIVNLVDMQLMVYRRPVDGLYQELKVLAQGDTIQPLAFPDVTIDVSEILA